MVVGDWIGRIRGAAGLWMRASADLAAIAALRGLGFPRRDAAGVWRVVSVVLESDADGGALVGHGDDDVGLPIAQRERYNVLANVTVSSASATAIAGLTAPVRASYRYLVRILLTHQRASGTGTLSITFTVPSGAQGRFIVSGSGASGTGDSPSWGGTISAASSTTRRATLIEGYLITDSAGDFVVLAANDGTNHTIYNGAYMTIEPLAQTGA